MAGIADKSESELESQKKKNMESPSACSSTSGIAVKSDRSESELESQKKKKKKNMKRPVLVFPPVVLLINQLDQNLNWSRRKRRKRRI